MACPLALLLLFSTLRKGYERGGLIGYWALPWSPSFLSSLFSLPPFLLTMFGPHHRLPMFTPAWASSYGGFPQPPRESISLTTKILLDGRVEEVTWRTAAGLSLLLLLPLGIARGHGSARAHSGGARSRSRYTSRNMWSKQLARFLDYCFRSGVFVGCFV